MSDNLNTRTAAEIVALIRKGDAKPSEVMADCLERISEREDDIGAFIHLDAGRAMERALKADKGPINGLLHGVPFAIKDIIDTSDMPTCWGSDIYADRQPNTNAHCVEAFLKAGAIPVGKTVTTEFAYFCPGKTANPHNPDHTPGGSSSGSAAAVADKMVPLAFGSQTAASLIRPAAYCGVCAFKPTTGAFGLNGVMGLSPSLDTLGVLARDINDLVLARSVLTSALVPKPANYTENLPRVSLMRGPHWNDGSVEMRDVCTRAMDDLSNAGAETGELGSIDLFAQLTDAQKVVMGYETAQVRLYEYENHKSLLSPQFTALIDDGLKVTKKDYDHALNIRDRAATVLERSFEETDAFLVPSAPGEAPRGLGATGDPLYSRMWNLLQVPCVALPCGTGRNGLPVGVQLIGRRGDDENLLNIAEWVWRTLKKYQGG